MIGRRRVENNRFVGRKRKRRATKELDTEQASHLKKVLAIVYQITIQEHPKAARTAYFGTSTIVAAIVPELLAVRQDPCANIILKCGFSELMLKS